MLKNSSFLGRVGCLPTFGLVLASLNAVEIIPTSYVVHQPTDTGSYSYHDETGSQLIDGAYGVAPWTANLGNGPAYEWLGWLYDNPVTIDFSFAGVQSIDTIHVGTVQDNVGDVVVPNVTVFKPDGTGGWILVASVITPESSANDGQYFTIAMSSLGITADKARVQLTFSYDGPWTFTDEVDFFSASSSVPEAGSTALLVLLGTVAFVPVARRQNQR